MIRGSLKKLEERQSLKYDEMMECMREIMEGNIDDMSIANFLLALKIKGETVDELKAMFSVMNEYSIKIRPVVSGSLIDTCGTGGDKIKTFNISTAAAFIAAGAGVHVAKHGNRSSSGLCGSADVLEFYGFDLNTEPDMVEKSIEQLGIGFMFAPKFHPAMKNASNARKQLGTNTAFNILGPLSNPANINAQVVGVSNVELIDKIIELLRENGREQAMVFHSIDGFDEISNTCANEVVWLRNGSVEKFDLNPTSFNVSIAEVTDHSVSSKKQSAEYTFRVLNGTSDEKKTDIVLLNAAAALVVADKVDSFKDGIELARKTVQNGEAYEKLRSLVKFCGDTGVFEEIEKKWGNS